MPHASSHEAFLVSHLVLNSLGISQKIRESQDFLDFFTIGVGMARSR